MSRDNCAALAFVLTALFVMGLSWFTRSTLLISGNWGKPLGFVIFIFGMAIFVWAAVYLGESFRGTVAPVSDQLVKNGPYRWVRHPLYLSMMVTLLGITTAMRSLWGIIGVFVLFLPAAIFRARLEEEALFERFGDEWDVYVDSTYFLIPWL